jgi:hypothetical protein
MGISPGFPQSQSLDFGFFIGDLLVDFLATLIAHEKAAVMISRRIMEDAPVLNFSPITEQFPPTLDFAIIVVYGFSPAFRAEFRVEHFLVVPPECCLSSICFLIFLLVSFVVADKFCWSGTRQAIFR